MRKKIHTEKFVLKIAGECGLTPRELKNQVNHYFSSDMLFYQVINFLACLTADDMRFMFMINKVRRKINEVYYL